MSIPMDRTRRYAETSQGAPRTSGGSNRVVILGGGITGLTAAYELKKLAAGSAAPEIVLLEASSRLGGKVLSEPQSGLMLEGGPDSFITAKPQALALIDELGLSGELLPTGPAQSIWVLRAGKLRKLPALGLGSPADWGSMILSDLLSWKGKLRAAREPWVAARADESDESLGSFLRRRLGHEVLDYAAGPVLAGIFAGDPERLSLESTFPQLRELERRGGLLRQAGAGRTLTPGRTLFMTLRGGLSTLTERLAQRLGTEVLRVGTPALSLSRRGRGWLIRTPHGNLEARTVISALPAYVFAGLVAELDLELSQALREIPFVSTATVSLIYEDKAFPSPLEGFGFVVPRSEGRTITAATYTSAKFPGRVPAGTVLIRCFMGRDGAEDISARDDNALAATAARELAEILGSAVRPKAIRVYRWPQGNPQYIVGHQLRLGRIESCLRGHPGLLIAGASYRGVGLPDCIASGRAAAAEALKSARENNHGH